MPLWAEIDLEAIVNNLTVVRRLVPAGTKIMAVVKANAYGHGAVAVAGRLASAGADALGVARLAEATSLREAGIQLPILIFGYTPPEAAAILVGQHISQTVFSLSYAERLNRCAGHLAGPVSIHIKLDTGMGRLGVMNEEIACQRVGHQGEKWSACSAVSEIFNFSNLRTEGIYTHFAASDSRDKKSAREQLRRFNETVTRLEADGLHIPVKHAANSGAVIDMPEAHLDMVRPGIMLYGLFPSDEVLNRQIDLKPAMQLKARIAQIKRVPKGFTVSYGHTYATPRETRLATLPIGYADGYCRLLSSRGVVLVNGHLAPVIGRVCMDQTMIDVGGIEGVQEGDEVVLIGKQGDRKVSAEMVAERVGTINYEIVSTLMDRVPRIYLE